MVANHLIVFHRRRLLGEVRAQLLDHLEGTSRAGVGALELRESVLQLHSLDALAHFCREHYRALTDRAPTSLQLPEPLLRRLLALRDRHEPPSPEALSV